MFRFFLQFRKSLSRSYSRVDWLDLCLFVVYTTCAYRESPSSTKSCVDLRVPELNQMFLMAHDGTRKLSTILTQAFSWLAESSQFGSRYIQVDDSGVYLSSMVVTVLVAAIATIGILLFTLVITLSVLLGSCQGQPLSVNILSPLNNARKSSFSCDSFILNAEVNNLQGWIVSEECVGTVAKYMRGGQYYTDFAGAIAAAADYLSGLPLKGDGSEVVVMDIDETALSNLPYYNIHNYGYYMPISATLAQFHVIYKCPSADLAEICVEMRVIQV
jgi:hypothetical protein